MIRHSLIAVAASATLLLNGAAQEQTEQSVHPEDACVHTRPPNSRQPMHGPRLTQESRSRSRSPPTFHAILGFVRRFGPSVPHDSGCR